MIDTPHAGSHASMPLLQGRRRRALRTWIAAAAVGLAAALAPCSALGASPLSWSGAATFDGGGSPRAISCPSESLCVVVDSSGHVLASSDPLATTPSWSTVLSTGHELTGVTCASPALCVAVGGGQAFVSFSPAAGGSWSEPQIDSAKTLSGVSCAASSLCAAVDESGRVLVTPAVGSAAWTPVEIDPGNRLQAISCTAAATCVAVDAAGNAFGSEAPAGGSAAWHRRTVELGQALGAVSCAPGGVCVALDGAGDALASADPGSASATWSSTPVEASPLRSISCDGAGLCVAVDASGAAWASDNPTAAPPTWSFSDPGGSLTGVSCLAGGACLAVDSAGQLVPGRVHAPEAFTAPPVQAGETSATLSATIDAHDAQLSTCAFEYGIVGQGYSHSVACSSLPAPAGGAQAVTAQVGGLVPNTGYHYRIVAASLAGADAGADEEFVTAVNSLVPIVVPHPAIHGTPAVGSRLTCASGTPAAAAQLSFAWLRDLVPIARATSSSYTVAGTDSGHHLQCQVTARNSGGTATARSVFVTIPVQGVLAAASETVIGGARYRKGALRVPVLCSGQAFSGCRLSIRLETLAGKRLTLAFARVRIGRGVHRTLALGLNSTGKRMLKSRRRAVAQLTVSGTVIGVIEGLLSRQRVTL
jgi:hypothetical protein